MNHAPVSTHPLRDFFLRGLLFGGFGPIVLAIIYGILQATLTDFALSGTEVCLGILSTYLLAFVHAGASVFNQIESWSVAKSMLFHFGSLYLAYTLCYISNSWIPFKPAVLGIFTAIFAGVYFVVWTIVVLCLKAVERKLNRKCGIPPQEQGRETEK